MNRHPRLGGMGLPNLQAYYFAMTLGQTKHWWHNSSTKLWSLMEAVSLGLSEWKAVLLDPFPNPVFSSHLSPPITATLNYWKVVFTEQCLQSCLSHTSIPLSFLPLHDSWVQKGLASIEDLFDGMHLWGFERKIQSHRNWSLLGIDKLTTFWNKICPNSELFPLPYSAFSNSSFTTHLKALKFFATSILATIYLLKLPIC